MKLPTLSDLNHISGLVYSVPLASLDDARKLQIIAIAKQGISAEISSCINDNLKEIASTLDALDDKFESIRSDMEDNSSWFSHIGQWFEKSKLWEGRIDK